MKVSDLVELYTNPRNLFISVSYEYTDRKWSIVVSKVSDSSNQFKPSDYLRFGSRNSKKSIIDVFIKSLEIVCKEGRRLVEDPKYRYRRPIRTGERRTVPGNERNFLKKEHLAWIRAGLESDEGYAHTPEMPKEAA